MTPPKDTQNGWPEHAKLVLKTLDRHEEWIKSIARDVARISRDVHLLKFKSGLWGVLGGAAAIAAVKLISQGT